MAKQARSVKKVLPKHRAVKARRPAPAVIPATERQVRRFARGRAVHVDEGRAE